MEWKVGGGKEERGGGEGMGGKEGGGGRGRGKLKPNNIECGLSCGMRKRRWRKKRKKRRWRRKRRNR